MKTTRRSDEIVKAAMQAACDVFGRPMSDMTSRARPEYIAWPRQIAMTLSVQNSKLALPDIAECFKHHRATVLHAVKVVKNRVEMLNSSAADYAAVAFRFEQLLNQDVEPVAVASTG